MIPGGRLRYTVGGALVGCTSLGSGRDCPCHRWPTSPESQACPLLLSQNWCLPARPRVLSQLSPGQALGVQGLCSDTVQQLSRPPPCSPLEHSTGTQKYSCGTQCPGGQESAGH